MAARRTCLLSVGSRAIPHSLALSELERWERAQAARTRGLAARQPPQDKSIIIEVPQVMASAEQVAVPGSGSDFVAFGPGKLCQRRHTRIYFRANQTLSG